MILLFTIKTSLLFCFHYSMLNSTSLLNFQRKEGFYERIFSHHPFLSAFFGRFRGGTDRNALLSGNKKGKLSQGCPAAAHWGYGRCHRSGAVRQCSNHTGGYLGQPQHHFQGRGGADLCRRLCLRARLCAECKRCGGNSCYGAVFEHKACAACVLLRLCAS